MPDRTLFISSHPVPSSRALSVESLSRFRCVPGQIVPMMMMLTCKQKITGSIEYQNSEQDTPKIVNFTVDNATEPMYEGDGVSFRVILDLRLRQLKVCMEAAR